MRRILICHLLALWCGTLMGQTINMTTVLGGTNIFTGCSASFFDGGGAAGAYASVAGTFTQVLTATSPNDVLHLTFSTLNLNQGGGPSNDDNLRVYLGIGILGPLIYDAPADVNVTDLDLYSAPGGSLTVVFIQNGVNNGPAPGWSATVECLDISVSPLLSNSAITTNNAYFEDPGGLAGNMDGLFGSGTGYYANNTANYYTICPANPGEYVSIDFLEFRLEPGYESMVILDGGISGGIIGNYTGTGSPGTITSSDSSGCLTIWFNSDNVVAGPGWLAKITNTTTRGSNSYCCQTYNCSGGCGTWICVSGSFEPNTGGGQGCTEDMRNSTTQGCLSTPGEVNSSWYYFSPATAGTLGFTISPPGGLDFDYALWKSPVNGAISCPLNTNDPPIRCSFSTANGDVGLDFTSVDFTEGAAGDKFTRYLDVLPGETYMLMLNCFSNGNPQANPTWTWTGTATLDCTPKSGVLVADFLDFYGRPAATGMELIWHTGSEIGSAYFEIQRGSNPDALVPIAQVPANEAPSRYSYIDKRLAAGTYYYQVIEVDRAGKSTKTQMIEIHVEEGLGQAKLVKIVDLLGVDVSAAPPHNQVLIKVFEDGTTEKFVLSQ